MKLYQKFIGGKTTFLSNLPSELRICRYFHVVPGCANLRFWFLCVFASGFVYFCDLLTCYLCLKLDGDTFCEHVFLVPLD